MMDLSLDDYISKGNKSVGFQKNRLGVKISPGRAKALLTKKNAVTQLRKPQQLNRPRPSAGFHAGNTAIFDARQKIAHKEQPVVQDARQKLSQKAKFSNVRAKILSPVRGPVQTGGQQRVQRPGSVQIKPGPIQIHRPVTTPATSNTVRLTNQDVRIKIQNAKAKRMDARDKIRARQQAKSAVQQVIVRQGVAAPGHGKVTVTGLGQSYNRAQSGQSVTTADGSLRRTINSQQTAQPTQQTNMPLRKTIQNSSVTPTLANRVGNNIVIAPTDQYASSQQQLAAPAPHPPPLPVQAAPQPQYAPQRPYTATTYQPPTYTVPEYHPPQPYMQSYAQPAPPQQQPQPQPQPQPQYSAPQEPMPLFRVRNDEYRAPEPAPKVTTQQSYYDRDLEVRAAAASVSQATRSPLRPVLQDRLGGVQEEDQSSADFLSPLQGYRLMITNLHPVVTQDDVVELFGAVGALRKAKLLRAGTGEVVFIRKEDALAAVRKYHNRELDGRPMQVVMATSGSVAPKPTTQDPVSEPLRLPKSVSTGGEPPINVDINLLHKALFKTSSKDDPPSHPVAFTVKI